MIAQFAPSAPSAPSSPCKAASAPSRRQSRRSSWRRRFIFPALPLLLPLALSAAHAAEAPSGAISPADLRTHLQTLDQLVASCQRAMIPANCQSGQVGPDLTVALPSGNRPVHLAWLRGLLEDAAKEQAAREKEAGEKAAKDAKDQAAKPKSPIAEHPSAPSSANHDYTPPTLEKRLADARQRLAEDAQWAALAANAPARPSAASPIPPRAALTAILAAKEYHAAVAGRSLRDRVLEKLGNWINRIVSKLVDAGARSKWIGITAEVAFALLLCVGLAWFLIRLERRGRFAPATIGSGPGAGAASARDWQLWLADARAAASRAAWRDAIHLLYWASISRLESNGQWPADRARTPREYLALLTHESAQHAGLAALTRSFERTWYAGRPATQADFAQAEQLAAQFGVQSGAKRGDIQGAR